MKYAAHNLHMLDELPTREPMHRANHTAKPVEGDACGPPPRVVFNEGTDMWVCFGTKPEDGAGVPKVVNERFNVAQDYTINADVADWLAWVEDEDDAS